MRQPPTSAIATAPQSGLIHQTIDALDFGRLPSAVRTEVENWSAALATVTPPIGIAIERIALSFGVSVPTARRKYDAFKAAGWAGLINRSKVPPPKADALPPEFITYWKQLCEANQRKSKPAHRRLLLAWHTGQVIPGYETCMLDRTQLPSGWSYANLMRYAPTEYELKRVRIGTAAVADMLPPVLLTRADLKVGQYMVFDDHEFNLKVVFPGQTRPMRPLMLGSLDLASGCLFSQGLRPTLWDDVSETKKKTTELEMRWLVINILISIGYRGDTGTILLVEHGTAAIREELKRRIELVTGGKVKVITSGIVGERQAAGSFAGRGKGNYRHKAALESLWALLDNECADLAGQVGKDRDHSPEELHGREREALRLLDAMNAEGIGVKGSALPPAAQALVGGSGAGVSLPSRLSLLRLPFLTWSQFMGHALDRFAWINNRRDHDLEGWGERITADPDIGMPVKMSPQEVWTAGKGDLIRVPIHRLMDLAGPDLARKLTVRRMLLTVHDQTMAPDPMHWLARFDGEVLENGREILGYLNPRDPDRLVAYDLQGRFLGVAEPWQRASRLDEHSMHTRTGAVAHIAKQVSEEQDTRRAPIARQLEDDAAYNQAVLTAGAEIPGEKEITDSQTPTPRRSRAQADKRLDSYAPDAAGNGVNGSNVTLATGAPAIGERDFETDAERMDKYL